MENATKALLMAGGVMIAMAIIGLAVAAFTHATGFAKENENAMSTSQIESFNRFYTAYLTSYSGPNEVRCIDAINILNRAVEDELEVVIGASAASFITDAGGFYTADPINYVSQKFGYSLKYNSALGVVEGVRIGN